MTNESKPITCLIIDDEPHAVGLLKALITENCPELTILGHTQSVDEAVRKINELNPELIFLDIKLRNQSGFDLLEQFERPNFKVVFTTAYNEYAIEAFNHAAIHYLMKPIDIEKLEDAVERIIDVRAQDPFEALNDASDFFRRQNRDRIGIPNRIGMEFIPKNDILYCAASGSYTYFHLKEGKEKLVSKPISYFEKMLDSSQFARSHRKYIVNLDEVVSLEKGKTAILGLSDGSKVEVSPSHKEHIQAELNKRIQF